MIGIERYDPLKTRLRGVAEHGMVAFEVAHISEITDDLWQGGCTRGLVLPRDVVHVVSLYPNEMYTVRHELRSVLTVSMDDSETQSLSHVDAIARWVNECRSDGVTLVQCKAGLNRSGIVVARALMLGGMTAESAISLLRDRRSAACLCNRSFESYLLSSGA